MPQKIDENKNIISGKKNSDKKAKLAQALKENLKRRKISVKIKKEEDGGKFQDTD